MLIRMETYVSGTTDLTDRILSPSIDISSTETGNEPSAISNCAEVVTLYLGNLRLSTISLAIEVRKPLEFAIIYVFIFGKFDGLSKLVTILPIPYGHASVARRGLITLFMLELSKKKQGQKMTLLNLLEKIFGITFFSSSTKSN